MELFEALIISLVGATAFSVTSLALYMISVRSMRRIGVFGPYLFKLDESRELREVREHIPPEVSEALDKIAQTMRDKFVQKIRERFRIKWYNFITIAVATFVIAFIVQLIVFLYLL